MQHRAYQRHILYRNQSVHYRRTVKKTELPSTNQCNVDVQNTNVVVPLTHLSTEDEVDSGGNEINEQLTSQAQSGE